MLCYFMFIYIKYFLNIYFYYFFFSISHVYYYQWSVNCTGINFVIYILRCIIFSLPSLKIFFPDRTRTSKLRTFVTPTISAFDPRWVPRTMTTRKCPTEKKHICLSTFPYLSFYRHRKKSLFRLSGLFIKSLLPATFRVPPTLLPDEAN